MSSWHAVRKSPKCWKSTSAIPQPCSAIGPHTSQNFIGPCTTLTRGYCCFDRHGCCTSLRRDACQDLSGPPSLCKLKVCWRLLTLSGSLFIRVSNSSILSFPFSASFCRFPFFWLHFVFSLAALLGPLLPPQSLKYWFGKLMVLDFCPFGCLLSSPFCGCLSSISVLLAAFCLLFGCLVGPAALSAVP